MTRNPAELVESPFSTVFFGGRESDPSIRHDIIVAKLNFEWKIPCLLRRDSELFSARIFAVRVTDVNLARFYKKKN